MITDPGQIPETTIIFRPNWVILTLAQLEQRPLLKSFDLTLPIGDPYNRPARGTRIETMLCPSDSVNNRVAFAGVQSGETDNWARGNYAVNAGNIDMRNLRNASSTQWNNNKRRGIMGPNNAIIALGDITDGTAFTFLVGEVRAGVSSLDRRGVWAMGGAGSSLVCWYGSTGDDNGPNFCDYDADDILGGPQFADSIPGILEDCMRPCSWCDGWQATYRSLHPNGVNIATADGSVHFIGDYIETSGINGDGNLDLWAVWDRLILSADKRPVDAAKAGL
jgi:prepilin-type processing-associated H-X9-DG protein